MHRKFGRENLRKTALLNMNNLKLMETILKVLREHLKEDDQMNTARETAGSLPETSLECEQILKRTRRILGGVNDGYLPEDLVLIASLDSCKGTWHNQSPR